jgi:Ca2+/Na+ antiporter
MVHWDSMRAILLATVIWSNQRRSLIECWKTSRRRHLGRCVYEFDLLMKVLLFFCEVLFIYLFKLKCLFMCLFLVHLFLLYIMFLFYVLCMYNKKRTFARLLA